MNEPFILILGARAPIALELARSFHQRGCTVILADSLRFPVSRFTNTIQRYERLPKVRRDAQSYITAVSALIERYQIDHLIPTCEEAFYVAQFKEHWKCKVWTPDIALMDALHNKETFASEFSKFLNIPETISAETFSDWSHSKDFVFKPKYSRFGSRTIINKSITAQQFSEPQKWIAQKKVVGKEVCVYSIWNDGTLTGYSCYSPTFRAGMGSGIFFEPVDHPQIKEQVQRFGEAIRFTGQLSFDVMVSGDAIWLLECNPRGMSGAHLLNDQLANCFLGTGEKESDKSGCYKLSSVMWFTHPLKCFTKKVRKATDVVFRINDPLPALLQWLSVLELVFIKFSKGISLLETTTFDIEWNGHED
ncbi:MAG: hypothetical protein JJ895_07420 [Balneolaceae bacterium]|nr:hypothetical protein [Balneolaceae bacterium]